MIVSRYGPTAGGDYPTFDDFSVNATEVSIPVPASIALFGLGGTVLIRRRR